MNVCEWLEKNYGNEVLDKFNKNMAIQGDTGINLNSTKSILSAFYWDETEEGFRFWLEINKEWVKFCYRESK